MEIKYIKESKEFCERRHMNPFQIPTPSNFLSQGELRKKLKEYDDVLSVVILFASKLISLIKDDPLLIVVSDEHGFILEMYGDEMIKKR
ncbi:hypothetical protein L1765_06800 [Microaerobacter geothermalis]|uniref:hypothetical protein n=1 Tax=Microaerobacter geothermalis TaxID=674972 RepID=UPI001F258418|nr:hypothetical protein [Microaerobacter geothermalis]MCF6093696.1 hypothetical protein [Microaerobacter geothermalis]